MGRHEILRGIYAAVRDRHWGTIPPRLSNLKVDRSDQAFRLAFDVEHRQGEIDFVWRGSVRGGTDGVLTYEFDGQARSSFLRNRIGFCVLHPIRECAGALARQTRVDGTVIEARFPQTIEPQLVGQSSFRDMRAVAHEVAPGLWAEVEFDGDVFEMEDQRNWTDASFKTYCTPLALPAPVEIQAGTRIRQSVTLRLAGTIPEEIRPSVETTNEKPESITMTVPDTPTARLPQIGLGMASHGEPLTETEIARLRRLPLTHLRAEVRLSSPDWPSVWRRAGREAGQLGVSLELALHLPREGRTDWQEFQRLLRAEPAPLARVLALRDGEAATTAQTLRQVRQALDGFEVPIGVGSDANFCELNREQALGQVPLADADFVFWSLNPQVHACDTPSIVENPRSAVRHGEDRARICRRQTVADFTGDPPAALQRRGYERFRAVAFGGIPAVGGPAPAQSVRGSLDVGQPGHAGSCRPRERDVLRNDRLAWSDGTSAWFATAGQVSFLAGRGLSNVPLVRRAGSLRPICFQPGEFPIPSRRPHRRGC